MRFVWLVGLACAGLLSNATVAAAQGTGDARTPLDAVSLQLGGGATVNTSDAYRADSNLTLEPTSWSLFSDVRIPIGPWMRVGLRPSASRTEAAAMPDDVTPYRASLAIYELSLAAVVGAQWRVVQWNGMALDLAILGSAGLGVALLDNLALHSSAPSDQVMGLTIHAAGELELALRGPALGGGVRAGYGLVRTLDDGSYDRAGVRLLTFFEVGLSAPSWRAR